MKTERLPRRHTLPALEWAETGPGGGEGKGHTQRAARMPRPLQQLWPYLPQRGKCVEKLSGYFCDCTNSPYEGPFCKTGTVGAVVSARAVVWSLQATVRLCP